MNIIHLKRLWIGLILVLAALIMAGDQAVQARGGGTIGYGAKVSATVNTDFPIIMFSFNGASGDWINATVDNWTGTINPQIELIAPDGQILTHSTPNILNGDALDAHVSAFLPQSGIYSLRITGQDGTTGDFLLALVGTSAIASAPLGYGQPMEVVATGEPQYFTFDTMGCPATLVIENPDAGQPYTFPFVAKIRDQRGETVALLRGGEQSEVRVTVAPNSGQYFVEISAADPTQTGTVRLQVSCSSQAPGCAAGQPGIVGAGGEVPGGGVPMCTSCPGADGLVEHGG
ncbi:MAG: hypothetical protein EHM39_12535, partial [Chloroflexi bacterium]